MYIVFGYKYKFLFPKKLSINPNQNSTKLVKGRKKTLWWEIKKTQYQNTYLKKPSTLIGIIRKNKNPPRERERESI